MLDTAGIGTAVKGANAGIWPADAVRPSVTAAVAAPTTRSRPARPGTTDPEAELVKTVFDTLGQGVLVFGTDGRIRAFNGILVRMLDLPPASIRVGMRVAALSAAVHARGHYGRQTLDAVAALWRERLGSRDASQHRTELATGRTVTVSYAPTGDGGWVLTYEDITDRLAVERALALQSERFETTLANIPHGLCVFDDDRRLIFCNDAYRRLYDLSEALVEPGTRLEDILAHRKALGNAPADMSRYYDVKVEAKLKGAYAFTLVKLDDGRTIRITHNPLTEGYVAVHEDVTAVVEAEQAIRHLGTHDALTGLANRVSLREQLAAALVTACADQPLAAYCLDLDDFKAVNDTRGHAIGDRLLQAVTARIAAILDEGATFARVGGDEFVVVQRAPGDCDGARRTAAAIVSEMTRPFSIDGHDLAIGVSVGIALGPRDGTTADDVLRNADIALYRAKNAGKNGFRFFESAMDQELQARRILEGDLRRAVAEKSFALFYQPQVDAATGVIRGLEALLRWTHPVRGPIAPLDFIPVAEHLGLIGQLGAWVIRQACRDAATWPGDVSVAVNLSALQFRDGTLPGIVADALRDAGLPASRLELEITESVLLVDNAVTLDTLRRLKALGVRIALDDFGTGYSSLNYLRAFPFDKIKIDRSFIRDLGDAQGSAVIVGAVVGLGTALGIGITAEGVETEKQLARVLQHGCHEVQGYLFSRPRPALEVSALLARGSLAARVAA